VLQGVKVMERPLALVLGEPELRHLAEQRLCVERVFQCLVNRRVRRPGFSGADAGRSSCGWCWDCGAP
jgi:hypothetical protein